MTNKTFGIQTADGGSYGVVTDGSGNLIAASLIVTNIPKSSKGRSSKDGSAYMTLTDGEGDLIDVDVEPSWVPLSANGSNALIDLDFQTSNFWFNGLSYPTFAAVLTAIGTGSDNGDGTYTLGPNSNIPFAGYSTTNGTIVCYYTATSTVSSTFAWTIQQVGATANFIRELAFNATNHDEYEVFSSNAIQAQIAPSATQLLNTLLRSVCVAKANDFQFNRNGVLIGTDVSGIMPGTITNVSAQLGHRAGAAKLPGTLYRWAYFPTAVTNTSRYTLSKLDNQPSYGAWTWFNEPRAFLTQSGVLTVADGQSGTGNIIIESQGTAPLNLKSLGFLDDHNVASLLRRSSDGKYIAHYCSHALDANSYQRISTNPDDLSAFDAEVNLGSTYGLTGSVEYSNLLELTSGIWHFGKAIMTGTTRGVYFSTSTDQGVTWAAKTNFVYTPGDNGNNAYWKQWKSGANSIDVICTNGHPDQVTNSLYYLRFDGTNWKNRAGSTLTLPVNPASNLTGTSIIWDAVGTGVNSWCWQIVTDGSGVPVVVFATFPTPASDHRYQYAKWNGSAWVVNQICTAGGPLYAAQPSYSGGVCIDPDNVNVIYCSRKDVNGFFQIWKGVTADGGVTWTMTQMTNDSNVNMRPYKTAGSNVVSFPSGTYTSYNSYVMWIKQLAA